MSVILLSTYIHAKPKKVFDLVRSVDLVIASTKDLNQKVIAGRNTGLLKLGEMVTWEAEHFGLKQQFSTQMVECDPPFHYRDCQVEGSFKRFDHDHYFGACGSGTLMRDVFDYDVSFGLFGNVLDVLFWQNYFRKMLVKRYQYIKSVAEENNSKKSKKSKHK